jgi:hypothetical protein
MNFNQLQNNKINLIKTINKHQSKERNPNNNNKQIRNKTTIDNITKISNTLQHHPIKIIPVNLTIITLIREDHNKLVTNSLLILTIIKIYIIMKMIHHNNSIVLRIKVIRNIIIRINY